jgi:lipopolysaccharide/colanic/teichoic acid biosynthesis glycosyltransferase
MALDPERASRPIWDRGTQETRVGRFLRYTRIEDLPQLVNVLRGDMRLIGAGVELPIFAD